MIKSFKKLLYRPTTPRVIQMENTECGAAVLAMILGYFGRYVPLQELREAANVTREGLSFEDLSALAKLHGLESEVYEATIEELDRIKLPVILYWDYNHFVVLEGFNGVNVYINNPAFGHQTITRKELEESYSGIILECKPGHSFEKQGVKQSLFNRLKDKLSPFKKSITHLLCIQIAIALISLSIPVFAQIFVDKFFGPFFPDWKGEFLALFAGIIIVSTCLTWLQQIFLNYF